MIETVIVHSIDDIMKIISEQTYNQKIGRMRSTYYYRGLPNASYKLTTSLRINCKHLSGQLEPSILKSFSNYACIEDPSITDSVWMQMIIGQHHGLPTRLMDWTYSPLIALHFAENVNNLEKYDTQDCVVWRVDIQDCNKNLPEKYKIALKKTGNSFFSLEALTKTVDNIEHYDRDMDGKAFVFIEPPSVDQRIVNQYSFFSIIPTDMEDVEDYLDQYTDRTVRFVIPHALRWDLRDLLDQYNVSERILYPGLDGLSQTLARHYYVK